MQPVRLNGHFSAPIPAKANSVASMAWGAIELGLTRFNPTPTGKRPSSGLRLILQPEYQSIAWQEHPV